MTSQLRLLLVLPILVLIACQAPSPSAADAKAFMDEAEQELHRLRQRAERAGWLAANFITEDTGAMEAEAQAALVARTGELAKQATRYMRPDLDADTARKLTLIRSSLPLAAPDDSRKQQELAEITSRMAAIYGKGRYCPRGEEEACQSLGELSKIMAHSRDPKELLEAWMGWRTISPLMRADYQRFTEIANEGARELGFDDLGALWRSGYDMPPEAFAAEIDRLWEQVKPLYRELHCYVRRVLARHYGNELVPPNGPIPAHLLGNMWAQSWGNIYDLVEPPGERGYDLGQLLRDKDVDERAMVRYGECFFLSLGFKPLPETFWSRSLFTRPRDREVVCHPSAWDVDYEGDLRLKMCIDRNEEDFVTIHHELGHLFYYQSYDPLPPLYRQSAHDGFHEAVGDTIALSITPEYLHQVGLLENVPGPEGDLGLLMKMALDKLAFLPFGLTVDQWRWKVFSGEITPENYNQVWWALREKYQGIAPPVARSEEDFDPGAKYHVPANTPYNRYFLAAILQFQLHRELCRIAGYEGPLHRCSIYDNDKAGEALRKMLALGRSKPWPDALEALSGQREMDATAIIDYFAPLMAWLEQQNAGQSCGW